MAAKKSPAEKTDSVLTATCVVTFPIPYKENERRNRKPLDILGIDGDELSDDQVQAAIDDRVAKLLETADLNVTSATVDKD